MKNKLGDWVKREEAITEEHMAQELVAKIATADSITKNIRDTKTAAEGIRVELEEVQASELEEWDIFCDLPKHTVEKNLETEYTLYIQIRLKKTLPNNNYDTPVTRIKIVKEV